MTIGLGPIVYILIFVAILVMVQGIYMLAFGKSISMNNRLSRRMALLEKTQDREKVLEQLRKEMNQHIKSRGIPLYSLLARKAQLANIAFTPAQLMAVMVLASVMAYGALTFGTGMALALRVFLAFAMGFGGVYVWLNGKAKARIKKLEEQLPDAIELMVRSLRVGHPLTSAIGIVAKEVADPLGSEFGVIADEAAYGRNIADSLKSFAERMDNQDLRFLAVAVNIQQSSGGNLAEILDGLSKVIRARFKLFRRVIAITAEAKFSGTFLSAFPVLGLIAILIMRPDYFDQVMTSSYFIPAVGLVVTFLVINVVFMKIMTNIKV
ncbi:MAG: type II secretion system F family protein [Cypionkella sp.]|nr:type II secretion system F family protein [Cypionkella sp.]